MYDVTIMQLHYGNVMQHNNVCYRGMDGQTDGQNDKKIEFNAINNVATNIGIHSFHIIGICP